MKNIKGIIFDYGGTLDTPSVHWSEVLWEGFQTCGIEVSKVDFREAYVHGERMLAQKPLIEPSHNFLALLTIKIEIELNYLQEKKKIKLSTLELRNTVCHVADYCNEYVCRNLEKSRAVVKELSIHFPLVLVSNFYGNIHTLLHEYKLDYFNKVIESAVVGVRKPNPEIFALGVDALGLKAEEVVVIGDSFTKDIIPAAKTGCRTIWFKGIGWGDEEIDTALPDAVITDLNQLIPLLLPSLHKTKTA